MSTCGEGEEVIQEFVDAWINGGKERFRESFKENFPHNYLSIVKAVIDSLGTREMNSDCVQEIDWDPSCEGTLLYIIGHTGYGKYFYYIFVNYGSCSGCDTLERIRDDGPWGSNPNEQQMKDLEMLGLHIVQALKKSEG